MAAVIPVLGIAVPLSSIQPESQAGEYRSMPNGVRSNAIIVVRTRKIQGLALLLESG
jgi:hypothetical protein